MWRDPSPPHAGFVVSQGTVFEYVIIACCVLSMVAFTFEEWRTFRGKGTSAFNSIESVVTAIFCAEFFLRVVATPKPWRMLLSVSTYVDLLALLPWIIERLYLATSATPDAAAIENVRILRIVRPFKMGRHSEWMRVCRCALAPRARSGPWIERTGPPRRRYMSRLSGMPRCPSASAGLW